MIVKIQVMECIKVIADLNTRYYLLIVYVGYLVFIPLGFDVLKKKNTVNVATTTKQPICENLPSGSDDTPKSYTPYIRYTKLEFKVKMKKNIHIPFLLNFLLPLCCDIEVKFGTL